LRSTHACSTLADPSRDGRLIAWHLQLSKQPLGRESGWWTHPRRTNQRSPPLPTATHGGGAAVTHQPHGHLGEPGLRAALADTRARRHKSLRVGGATRGPFTTAWPLEGWGKLDRRESRRAAAFGFSTEVEVSSPPAPVLEPSSTTLATTQPEAGGRRVMARVDQKAYGSMAFGRAFIPG